MTEPLPPAPHHSGPTWQQLTNAAPFPDTYVVARHPIAVRARLDWQHDGAEIIDTVAERWTTTSVWVAIRDRRFHALHVWLPARDVVRA